MRSVRTVLLGFAVAACVFGASSTAAFAKVVKPAVFGKFVASTAATDAGHGEVSAMRLGPYLFTGKNLGEGQGFGPVCEAPLKSRGVIVTPGESETFTTKLIFTKCFSTRRDGSLEEAVAFSFKIGVEFHSNQSAVLGETNETEVGIKGEGAIKVKGAKSSCSLLIPEQTVPVKAATHPEDLFESASYETEKESLEGHKFQEMKFGPFRERLAISMNFHKITVQLQLNQAKGCTDENREEGTTFEPETDTVAFHNGVLEAELEHITLKEGNLSFVPAM